MPPRMQEKNKEDIIKSGSSLLAARNKFFPKPISAPLNSATIEPITARVELIFNPANIEGNDRGI